MELEKIQVANVKSDDRALEFYYHPTFSNDSNFVNTFIKQIIEEDLERIDYIKIKPWQQEEKIIVENIDLKKDEYTYTPLDKGKVWSKGHSAKLYVDVEFCISTETNTIVVSSSDLYVITEYLKRGEHKAQLLHDFNVYMDAHEIETHIELNTKVKELDTL